MFDVFGEVGVVGDVFAYEEVPELGEVCCTWSSSAI